MITKLKNFLSEIKENLQEVKTQQERIYLQQAELLWAQIYHDTIKDKEWLNNLAVSPGRWAGNYSFLYVLVRILSDFQPMKIIEFGLGESSKIIAAFLTNQLQDSSHLILEQDEKWINGFSERFSLPAQSTIVHLPLVQTVVHGFPVNCYKDLKTTIPDNFQFYVVDGPFGSERYSRYDICTLTEQLEVGQQFVILIDDYNRLGEQDTSKSLIDLLNKRGHSVYSGIYNGIKSQVVIASEGYRGAVSM